MRPTLSKTLLLGIFLTLPFLNSTARADGALSSVNLGLNFYSQKNATAGTAPLGSLGYGLGFETSAKDTWIRPNFGAALGYTSGVDTLITGEVNAGVDIVAMGSRFLHPLVGIKGEFGWAHLSEATTSSIGFVYGGVLQGGAEFKFSEDAHARMFRIITALHYLLGKVGSLSGTDLNSLTISIGMIF